MTGNSFWDTCKPYFSNKKIKTSGNIILSDKEGLILKWAEVAREFNIYFQSITSSLGLFNWPDSSESLKETDPVKSIVNKYKGHPSIKKIKVKYITVKPFSFRPVTTKDVPDVPDLLKLAEITPIHKKEDPFDEDNYRPVSIWPLMSKAFE